MRVLGIIPARYASSRFPGKPLADIDGKPMIWYVYQAAHKALDEVVVATDDERIFDAVKGFGGEVVMTSTEHRSGTDRCAEALYLYSLVTNENFDIVVNIQGDEPLIEPEVIETLAKSFDCKTQIATLINREDNIEVLQNPNVVKVIRDKNGDAIYFSRSIIPFVRGEKPEDWPRKHVFYRHVGIYAYRSEVLSEITKLPPGLLEQAESLEQNRWIENGYKIKTIITDYSSIGVDTPEDLKQVEQIIKQNLPE